MTVHCIFIIKYPTGLGLSFLFVGHIRIGIIKIILILPIKYKNALS